MATTRFINNDTRSSRQSVWCHFINPATELRENGYLVDLYQIRDPEQEEPTNEVVEVRTKVDPQRSISASGSSDGCSVSMSGSLGAGTSTETITKKVWNQVRVGMIFKDNGEILTDIPIGNIEIAANDLKDLIY